MVQKGLFLIVRLNFMYFHYYSLETQSMENLQYFVLNFLQDVNHCIKTLSKQIDHNN